MTKIIGIVILSVSIILIGLIKYEKYFSRKNSLKLFIDILKTYLISAKLSRKTMKDTVLMYEHKSEYLDECKRLLLSESLYDSMISKNDCFAHLYLKEEDIAVIKNFFANCGKGDYKTEMSLCNDTLSALQLLSEQADGSFKKTAPLVVKLSIIGAACLFILLV